MAAIFRIKSDDEIFGFLLLS